jgi:hypothetical protein
MNSPAYVDRSLPPKGIDVFVQAPEFVHPDPQAVGWNDMEIAINQGLTGLWDSSKPARQVVVDIVPQVDNLLKQNA